MESVDGNAVFVTRRLRRKIVNSVVADSELLARARDVREGRGGPRLLRRVARLIAEARLACWLVAMNLKGVAVSAAQLVVQMRVMWPSVARGWQSDAWLARIRQWPRRRKAFSKTFRIRWGVVWRRLPTRADMDTQDLLFRAPRVQSLKLFGAPRWGRFLAPFLGPPVI